MKQNLVLVMIIEYCKKELHFMRELNSRKTKLTQGQLLRGEIELRLAYNLIQQMKSV